MLTLRKANDRGHANHGWLDSHFTFSFADYHDPRHMGFRSLRVINDDRIAPGGGFGMHPHRDMEIISYVLAGALEHKDSMGNGSVIRPGDFQYMSAGTGVTHSEFNPSDRDATHLLQIWIKPDRPGVTPRYGEKAMHDAATGRLHLVASPSGRDGSIAIHQDVELFLARLGRGDAVTHALAPKRHAWIHVAEGEVDLNGETLAAGDAAALSEEREARLSAKSAAQVLLFDLH
ncbi:MAG: pirin family protein [Verrucomicrobia bacterium]|nr:pirin family protein [Verrucomicrobiota bacterium]